jgi:mRNA-degrading endonuclease RelE of RelBE toxin-antitoxin system
MNRKFIETWAFTQRMKTRITDEEYRALQQELLTNPEAGEVIRDCAGVRKIRCGDSRRGKGKRGGCRVIYWNAEQFATVFVLTIYSKDETDDLDSASKRALRQLVQALEKEMKSLRQRN